MKKLLLPITLTLLISLSLTACAPTSLRQLRQEAAGKFTFEIDEDYQVVFRKIVTQCRECYHEGLYTDVFNDINTAHVFYSPYNAYGEILIAIDIEGLPGLKTRVTSYYGLVNWKNNAAAVEKWLEDGYNECEYPTRKAPQ